MRPEHLDLLAMCATPTLHPDGSLAIVSVIRPDLDSNEYVGGLWSVPLDGSGPPRRLTRGHRDTGPAISPDGALVAFLRAAKEAKPQLYVVEVGGGEPVALTDAPLGAGAPRWSPDSRRIAFAARVPEQGRYGTDEDIDADSEAPRLITKLAYREDGLGYTNDRPNHLFVLDVPDLDALEERMATSEATDSTGSTGSTDSADSADGTTKDQRLPEARQITDGDYDDVDVSWSPDGSRLVFVSDRDMDGGAKEHEDLTSSIFTCTPDGSDLSYAAGTGLSCNGPQWTLDGLQIVFLAQELGANGLEFVARNSGLYAVPAPSNSESSDDGSTVPGSHRRLTDAETIDLGEVGSHLSVNERGVIVQDRRRGTVRLLEIDPTGDCVDVNSAVEIAGGQAWHRGHAVTLSGDTVVAAVAEVDRPSDLVLVRHPSAPQRPRRLTDVSRRLRDVARPQPPVEREILGADGYPVHGWAVLPDPDVHGGGPYPVLLNIHGGPYASYVGSFFDEPQVYAGAGYAVLMCNPRGSAGYGQAHGLAIKGAMGSVDADDILAFLETALQDPELSLDADRVGVMGGSYGGYMTAWLTTRTNRFAAAIVERGYLDAASFVGSSDIGWFFPDQYHRTEKADGAEAVAGTEKVGRTEESGADPDAALREQSPMSHVDRVTTPTMVIHSEADWRTPIEQGQRWFVALRRLGVPAQLLIFPGEGHEMSRSGKPTHRRDRFAHILRWWSEHLPVTERLPITPPTAEVSP
ncbi:MAG: S9 family peptidase [Geodermatophilaceae bacterium]